jgi:hypothetical protein
MLLGPINFYPDQNKSVVSRKWHPAMLSAHFMRELPT